MNLRKHELLGNIHKLHTKLKYQIPKLVSRDLLTMNGHYKKEQVLAHHVEAIPHSFYQFLFSNMKFIPNEVLKKFEKQLKQEVSINHLHLLEETKKWLK